MKSGLKWNFGFGYYLLWYLFCYVLNIKGRKDYIIILVKVEVYFFFCCVVGLFSNFIFLLVNINGEVGSGGVEILEERSLAVGS